GVPQPPVVPGPAMRVEPNAIPGLINALQNALDSVGLQIEHAITDLRIRPWAGDPVSADAAQRFNQHSLAGDDDALASLCAYRDQLQSAADTLKRANQQYGKIDDHNAKTLNTGC